MGSWSKNNSDKVLAEICAHAHNYEKWFEKASAPSGETHVSDSLGSGIGAFQIDAGNDDWGSWLQILGSSDTPVIAGKHYFCLNRIACPLTELNSTYFIQIAFGSSGADSLSAGTYSELVLKPLSNQAGFGPIDIVTEKQNAETKVWARCKCPGQNTATLNFYFGLHEYNE